MLVLTQATCQHVAKQALLAFYQNACVHCSLPETIHTQEYQFINSRTVHVLIFNWVKTFNHRDIPRFKHCTLGYSRFKFGPTRIVLSFTLSSRFQTAVESD